MQPHGLRVSLKPGLSVSASPLPYNLDMGQNSRIPHWKAPLNDARRSVRNLHILNHTYISQKEFFSLDEHSMVLGPQKARTFYGLGVPIGFRVQN